MQTYYEGIGVIHSNNESLNLSVDLSISYRIKIFCLYFRKRLRKVFKLINVG